MYAVGLGVIFLLMKYMEVSPVATWPWWVVFTPFAVAVAWWTWADATGYTKRKAMEQEDARKKDRIERNREAMGFLSKKKKKR